MGKQPLCPSGVQSEHGWESSPGQDLALRVPWGDLAPSKQSREWRGLREVGLALGRVQIGLRLPTTIAPALPKAFFPLVFSLPPQPDCGGTAEGRARAKQPRGAQPGRKQSASPRAGFGPRGPSLRAVLCSGTEPSTTLQPHAWAGNAARGGWLQGGGPKPGQDRCKDGGPAAGCGQRCRASAKAFLSPGDPAVPSWHQPSLLGLPPGPSPSTTPKQPRTDPAAVQTHSPAQTPLTAPSTAPDVPRWIPDPAGPQARSPCTDPSNDQHSSTNPQKFPQAQTPIFPSTAPSGS